MRSSIVASTMVLGSVLGAQAHAQDLATQITNYVASEIPGGGECFSGTCYPITFAPGDVTVANPGSLTDSKGNTWSLIKNGPVGPGAWWADVAKNGQAQGGWYDVALRLVNSDVWVEEAKHGGWWDLSKWAGGSDRPGLGGDPGGGTGAATSGQANASPTPAPTQNLTLAPFANPTCPTQTFSWQSSSVATPGNGAFTVGSDTYTVDAIKGDVASINGTPINDGAYGTSQLTQGSDGVIYGQDETSHQWFQLHGTGNGSWWEPLDSTPAAISNTGTTPATNPGAALNTSGTFSQQNGYFEATVAPGGNFSLVSANGATLPVGQATDSSAHVYAASVTPKQTTLYSDAQQVSQTATPAGGQSALSLAGTNVQQARVFPSQQDALACVPTASAAATPPATPSTTQTATPSSQAAQSAPPSPSASSSNGSLLPQLTASSPVTPDIISQQIVTLTILKAALQNQTITRQQELDALQAQLPPAGN